MIQNKYEGLPPQPLRSWSRAALLALILLVPMGCKTGTLKNDKELTTLLSDLNKRNQKMEKKKLDRMAGEFRTFQVTRSSEGVKVTLNLVDAPADTAFLRLMNEAGTPFRMGDVTLPGRVTVAAQNVSLFNAARRGGRVGPDRDQELRPQAPDAGLGGEPA